MKIKLTVLILLFFTAQIVIGQDFRFGKVSKEELQEKVHPTDSDANAAVLYRELKTNFDYSESDGFYAVTDVYERIKIYKKEGFDWGTRSIGLYQSSNGKKEEMVNLKAYTYSLSAQGKIEDEKLKSDGIFVEEASKYWDRKKFTMPNLSEGCVIEFRYTLKTPFISSINEFDFQETIPVNLVEVRFAVPEYLSYKTHQKGWLPIAIDSDSKPRTMRYRYTVDALSSGDVIDRTKTGELTFREEISTVTMKNVPALKEEPYSSNINNFASSLKFELAFTKFPNSPYNSYSHSWEDVSENIYKSSSFGDELEKSSYYEDDIDAILSGVNDPEEKMIKIFELAKSKMTWNSLYGYYVDEGVKKAYNDGSGNVADLNLALTSMFRYAGLNASPVLVSTRNHGVPIFPTRDGFNYVISGVIIDGAVYLCDATNKSGEVNILEEALLNWQGRMIIDEKTSAWVPLSPGTHAVKNTMLNIEIAEDFTVKGTSQNRATGHYAMETRDTFENLNDDAKRKNLEKGKGETELSNVAFENLDVLHQPVGYSFDFNATNALEEVGGKLYFSPLIYLTTLENPFKLEDRKYPVDYGYSRKDRYLVSISIPEGYTVESMPESASFGMEQGIGSYKYIISNTGNKIQLSVELALNEAVIPAGNYASLKKFFEILIAKENEKVVLSKT